MSDTGFALAIDLAEKGKRIELGIACILVPAVDAHDSENRINEGMDTKGECPSVFSIGQIELSSQAAQSRHVPCADFGCRRIHKSARKKPQTNASDCQDHRVEGRKRQDKIA